MNDRYPQTVGFVVAGVGLAATFLEWPTAAALAGHAATAFAALAAVAFVARRHGVDVPLLDYVAAACGVGLALAATAGLLVVSGPLPPGPTVGLFAGLSAVGAATAAAAGLDASAVHAREWRLLVAVAASVGALLFGALLAGVALGFVPEDPLVSTPVNTAVASLGYAVAGVAFVRWFDLGFDVRRPTRSDAVVAGVGVVVILALHYAMVSVVVALDLPQASHGLVVTAREHPGILPPLVVLSYLAIGPAEELLARNGVQKYLYGAYSRRGAVLVGCLVFAGVHVLAYAGAGATAGAVVVTLARLFVVSLVLGVVYERTDDLFAPVVVHGTYDAVQFGLAYLTFTGVV